MTKLYWWGPVLGVQEVVPLPEGWPARDHDEFDELVEREKLGHRLRLVHPETREKVDGPESGFYRLEPRPEGYVYTAPPIAWEKGQPVIAPTAAKGEGRRAKGEEAGVSS